VRNVRFDSSSLALTISHGFSPPTPCTDVDDLEDIGALETYVEETLEMLLFLSGGYLQSRNCLREVQATVDQDKPYMLVHEQDQTHGGAPLDKLMQQLTDVELRKQIFDGRVPIVWHRIADVRSDFPDPPHGRVPQDVDFCSSSLLGSFKSCR
jgi:hypothetical protein